MPEEEYVWLPRADILTFNEMSRLVDVFASLGVSKVRITGGEPLMRGELPEFVRIIAAKPTVRDLAVLPGYRVTSRHIPCSTMVFWFPIRITKLVCSPSPGVMAMVTSSMAGKGCE
jgi:hypothetical protein